MAVPRHMLLMRVAAEARKRRNPLDYIDGVALGHFLRHNDYPQPDVGQGPPIVIPGGANPRRRRRGPLAY